MNQQARALQPPPNGVYSSLDELLLQANGHAVAHGYKFVVVRSKTNTAGHKTWVHLACDRHGTKRNTHNLTDETRKKNRRSRRCECPMYCVASKSTSDLWELTVRNGEHNHEPYEPPASKSKKKQPPHGSEIVNLPLLITPSSCTADFCLIPMGTPSPSVSAEIAEVQRLLKRSGLHFSMHAAGTTIEGPWDDVMRIIGQAHSFLHGSGIVRIQSDIRVGSRTDKKQSFEDKVASVRALLDGDDTRVGLDSDDALGDDPSEVGAQHMNHAIQPDLNHNIAPNLDRVLPPNLQPQMASMNHPMAHPMSHHAMTQHMNHQMAQSMNFNGPGN